MNYYERLRYRRYGINPCVIVSAFQKSCQAEWNQQKLSDTWAYDYEWKEKETGGTTNVLRMTFNGKWEYAE